MDKLPDSEIVKAKIKAIYPHIVVSSKIYKPYYYIHWYDIEDKSMHIGYGSFNLKFVRKWLQEEFEVVEIDIENLINRLQAENERLKTNLNVELENFATEYDNKIKAEAYKECIEKVKALFPSDNEHYQYWEIHEGADNLLKELVGEDNASFDKN